nr:hypothetical protein [Bremerella alba]
MIGIKIDRVQLLGDFATDAFNAGHPDGAVLIRANLQLRFRLAAGLHQEVERLLRYFGIEIKAADLLDIRSVSHHLMQLPDRSSIDNGNGSLHASGRAVGGQGSTCVSAGGRQNMILSASHHVRDGQLREPVLVRAGRLERLELEEEVRQTHRRTNTARAEQRRISFA